MDDYTKTTESDLQLMENIKNDVESGKLTYENFPMSSKVIRQGSETYEFDRWVYEYKDEEGKLKYVVRYYIDAMKDIKTFEIEIR